MAAGADTLRRIVETGVVPVIRAASGQEALAVVDAIRAGGIDVVELTMTVPGAVEVIRELARRCGDEVLLGAGTVLEKARQYVEAVRQARAQDAG